MFFTERHHSDRSALGLTGSYETGRIDQAEVRTKCANSILVRTCNSELGEEMRGLAGIVGLLAYAATCGTNAASQSPVRTTFVPPLIAQRKDGAPLCLRGLRRTATRRGWVAARRRGLARLRAKDGRGADEGENEAEHITDAEIYSELRDKYAVVQEAPTIASKRGGFEKYMPPSFKDREQQLLPRYDGTRYCCLPLAVVRDHCADADRVRFPDVSPSVPGMIPN